MVNTIWGVDSATNVNNILFECVRRNYGMPKYWGRYLTRVEGAAEGLTTNEVRFLHQKGVKIIPIYSAFRRATGFSSGQIIARNALFHARRLRIPKGLLLVANIEHFFEVDAAWIRGWTTTIQLNGYRPGIYHDPIKGKFSAAYCQAVSASPEVASQLVLWSAEPEPGVSKEADAPSYAPASPPCTAQVQIWQYGRDSRVCPIDTNLMRRSLYNLLW